MDTTESLIFEIESFSDFDFEDLKNFLNKAIDFEMKIFEKLVWSVNVNIPMVGKALDEFLYEKVYSVIYNKLTGDKLYKSDINEYYILSVIGERVVIEDIEKFLADKI